MADVVHHDTYPQNCWCKGEVAWVDPDLQAAVHDLCEQYGTQEVMAALDERLRYLYAVAACKHHGQEPSDD